MIPRYTRRKEMGHIWERTQRVYLMLLVETLASEAKLSWALFTKTGENNSGKRAISTLSAFMNRKTS